MPGETEPLGTSDPAQSHPLPDGHLCSRSGSGSRGGQAWAWEPFWLPLGEIQLEYGLGRDAFQGSIQQKQAFEDRLAEGDIRLLEPAFTLTIELLFDVPVGQDGKNRHGYKGTAHEQCKKPATESAPQRCRRKSHLAHVEWLVSANAAAAFPYRASVMPPETPP